jgi:putative hemolysin
MRGNLGALHAQGEHCEQCNICKSPKSSSASAVKSKWRRLLSTGVLLQHDSARSHTARSTVNTPRSVIRMSSTSTVLARPHPQWLSRLWTAQRGDGRQVFQVRWRGAAGGAWVAVLSAKRLPKHWNTCMVCNGDYVEKWSHSVPFVFNKLRDKKYLRFSFGSPM